MRFVVIFGPPAVGKMAVGQELCKLTGFKLFHNHMTVEPVLDIFEFGSAPFSRLVNEFRRRVIEEAMAAELPGLVFTFVWGLELASDRDLVESYAAIIEAGGGTVHFVELYAEQPVRVERNRSELRLAEKRSKRDLAFSHDNLMSMDAQYVMNTGVTHTLAEDVVGGRDYLRIDNTAVPAAEAARQIVAAFSL